MIVITATFTITIAVLLLLLILKLMILLALSTTKAVAEKAWNFQAWKGFEKTSKILFKPHYKCNNFMR